MKPAKSNIFALTRGSLYALLTTLVFVLILALIVQLSGMGSTPIGIIMQIIKVISIFYGVAICVRKIETRGWIYGAILGIVYTPLAFFTFSILGADFNITTGLLADMLFAIVIGTVSAFLVKGLRAPAH